MSRNEGQEVNKNVVMVCLVVVFFVAALYFFPSLERDEFTTESEQEIEAEMAMLKQDIESLQGSLFEAEKFIFSSDLANDYLFYADTEILYQKIEDSRYMVLFKKRYEKTEKFEYLLKVETNDISNINDFNITTFEPKYGITLDFVGYNDDYYVGGIITDTEIKDIQVLYNAEKHDAEIFKINDALYGWYSFFKSEHNDSGIEDRMKIRVLDEKGKEIWNKPQEELW